MALVFVTIFFILIFGFWVYFISNKIKNYIYKTDNLLNKVYDMIESSNKYEESLENVINKKNDEVNPLDVEKELLSTPYDKDGRGSVLDIDTIEYPDVSLNDIKNKTYNSSVNERIAFPLIDDGFPTVILLPLEVVSVLRKEFNLENYENPITRNQFIGFILENNIRVGLKHIVNAFPHNLGSNALFIPATSKVEDKNIFDAVDNNHMYSYLKIIRYVENGEIFEKVTNSCELYSSYLKCFPDVMQKGMPNGSQFLEWYDNAVDELIRLNDYDQNEI